MDRQRVESAKSVFVGQSDKFVANPHVLPSLITELGATTTTVHSFGVQAEDHSPLESQHASSEGVLQNPKNGKATPINLVNFCPEIIYQHGWSTRFQLTPGYVLAIRVDGREVDGQGKHPLLSIPLHRIRPGLLHKNLKGHKFHGRFRV
jgi:hypothetical protein